MILSFFVENFKIFKDGVSLSLYAGKSDKLRDFYVVEPFPKRHVLRMAMIYGPNASGKTTLVDALFLLKGLVVSPLSNKEETFEDQVKPFMGDENRRREPTRFKIDFFSNGLIYSYYVAVDKYSVVEEELRTLKFCKVRSRSSLIYKRRTDKENRIALIEFGKGIKLGKSEKKSLEHNTLWNNTVLGGYLKTNLSVEVLDSAVSWFLDRLIVLKPYQPVWPFIIEKLEKGDIDKAALISLLRRADFRIEDFEIREREIPKDVLKLVEKLMDTSGPKEERKAPIFKELYLKHGTGSGAFYLPLMEESRGTVRFLELCCLMSLMEEASSLVVDEIEASLHPDLLEHFLVEFLERKDKSQIIATTHYRELMKSEIFREDVLWFTEVKEDGSGDLYSLMDFSAEERRKIRSIYNAYRIGKLGGVPQIL